MTMRKCHQPTKTCDASRYLSAKIEVHSRYVLISLLLLLHFSVFSANAQWQREQIVFVSQEDNLRQIRLTNGLGGQVKKLTLQGRYATPSLSYDGKRVAFAWAVNRRRNYEIFVMEIPSGGQRRVAFSQNAGIHSLYPCWAPDGSRIVFASNFDGDYDLYTVDEKGNNRTPLTDSDGDDVHPDWSPDGSKIVFASDQHRTATQVWLLEVKTGHQQILTESQFPTAYPRWSPDGTQVAYYSAAVDVPVTGGWQIWEVSTDGRGVKRLIVEGDYNDVPAVSPDGKQIAFSSRRNNNLDIYVYDRDSMQTVRLTRDPSIDSSPSFSPDGRHLVFVSERTGNFDIHRLNAEGGGIVNLTQSEVDEYRPAWSPIENIIIFERKVAERRGIHVMDSNGNRQMLLDNSPFFNGFPAWSPQGDKIAFVNYPTPDSKVSRIYTIDADGQNKHLLFEAPSPRAIRKISWSPDGKKMLFVYSERSERGLVEEIRLLDVITREVNSIDLNLAGSDNAVWAPFGRTIVFSAFPAHPRPAVRYGIFMVDTDGSNQETIWDTLNPEILHERFSWSPDGQRILFGRGTGSLYLITLHNRAVKLFIRNAHSPDWKTPRVWQRSVEPNDKLHTAWGEVKEINRR